MRNPTILLLLLAATALRSWGQPASIAPAVLDALARQGQADCFVILEAQADLSAAQALPDKASRGRFVWEQLQAFAEKAQQPVRALLEAEGVAYRPFFIVNAVFVAEAPAELVWRLAQVPGVARIAPNPSVRLEPVEEVATTRGPEAIEWGIDLIDAEQVWAMGYRGQGAVVAGQDTGYDWLHPALKTKYRGYDAQADTADHNYNWHDAIHEINPLHGDSIPDPALNPCGLDTLAPCDDHNHGTHTMGIMVGSADDNEIGVAPEAQWIGCRNMERGYGTPYTYLECFEWFLAPTDLDGQNPDPDKAPHVINNSWSCPPMEGCNPDNFYLLETAVNNLDLAGIVVVVSAGNSGGSGCGSVNAPAAIFERSFTVGASDINDQMAGFSSRGPVVVDSSYRRKPDVVAPGVGVRSSIRNGGYATFSGTSMAGPHVAGVVALMISANPSLAGHTDAIKDILQQTAVPLDDSTSCGGIPFDSIPNNVQGYGRIDALAAVQLALAWQPTAAPAPAPAEVPVQVFPNPTDGPLFFLWPEHAGVQRIRLFDAAGREVRRVVPAPGSHAAELHLPKGSGIWFYTVEGTHWLRRGKVVQVR